MQKFFIAFVVAICAFASASAGTRTETFNSVAGRQFRPAHPIRLNPSVPVPIQRGDNLAGSSARVAQPFPPPPKNIADAASPAANKKISSAQQAGVTTSPSPAKKNVNSSSGKQQKAPETSNSPSHKRRIEALEAKRLDPAKKGISSAKNGQSTVPRNDTERLLWAETLEKPRSGKMFDFDNKDLRFKPEEGWKKHFTVKKIPRTDGRIDLYELHYQLNLNTGLVADLKTMHRIIKG